jgi:hypothetical protein
MSFLSGLATLAHMESESDYKVKHPHRGWAVLSLFGPTTETNVTQFWKYQRGCDEGATIERFLKRYHGRVELALVPVEEVGLEYKGRPQKGMNILVVRPTAKG